MELSGKRSRPRQYHITFEPGHDLEDLELIMHRISLEAMTELSSAADEVRAVNVAGAAGLTAEQTAALRTMAAQLAAVIDEWNRDDLAGHPVTPDFAGVMAQDPWVVMGIFEAYADRVLTVAPPLPAPSGNGAMTSPDGTPSEATSSALAERSLELASSSTVLPSPEPSTTPG